MRIILASGSPRRKEIFSELVKKFEIIPAIGEEVISKNSPSEVVMELSHQKAMEVYGIEKSKNCNEELLIIGADTVVSLNDKIIGKPKNIEEAFEIIKELSGRTHKVYTGVTIIHFKNDNEDIETFF